MNSLILYNIFTKTLIKTAVYTAEERGLLLMSKFEEMRRAYNTHGDIIVTIENYDWREHGLKDIKETIRCHLKNII